MSKGSESECPSSWPGAGCDTAGGVVVEETVAADEEVQGQGFSRGMETEIEGRTHDTTNEI